MRERTYRCFECKVLAPIERTAGRPLHILDLGAGAGWLSHRLALRGHRPVAVDLLVDSLEGLAAPQRHLQTFHRLQADFDAVPLAAAQFDLAVFNASLHHSVDYRATLREARRLLGWGGQVVVLETPIYESYTCGELAREVRLAQLERTHGFPPPAMLAMGYLDDRMIRDLGRDLNIRWRAYRPWCGLPWRLLPSRDYRLNVLVGCWTGVSSLKRNPGSRS